MNIGAILFDNNDVNWRGMKTPAFVELENGKCVLEVLIKRIKKNCVDKVAIVTRSSDPKEIRTIKALKSKYNTEVYFNESLSGAITALLQQHINDKIAFFVPEEPLIDWDIINDGFEQIRENEIVRFDGFAIGSTPKVIIYKTDIFPHTVFWKDINKLEFLFDKERVISNRHETPRVTLQISDHLKLDLFKKLVKAGMPILEPTSAIIQFLDRQDVITKVFSLFKDIETTAIRKCALCGGMLEDLGKPVSEPSIGFLCMNKSFYSKCRECQLVALNPTFNEKDLVKLYDGTYSEVQEGSFLGERLKTTLAHATREEGNLLDVGGSGGKFCLEFKKERPDFNVSLLDVSPEAVKVAKNRDIQAFSGDILTTVLPKNNYDVITVWEVIEHAPIATVIRVFDRVHELLKPGGVCLFSTPNYESFMSKVFDYYVTSIPFHLYVFSNSSLRAVMKKTAFRSNFELKSTNLSSQNWIKGWMQYYAVGAFSKNLRNFAEMSYDLLANNSKEAENYFKFILDERGVHILGICRRKESNS